MCISCFIGFELTFFSGVFGNAIGNISDKNLVDPKRQIGLMGMSIGVGEICGGLLFSIFGKLTRKYGRDFIVLLGFIIHLVTFFLIYLNVPDEVGVCYIGPLLTGYLDIFRQFPYKRGRNNTNERNSCATVQ